jgi:hypothetical protein
VRWIPKNNWLASEEKNITEGAGWTEGLNTTPVKGKEKSIDGMLQFLSVKERANIWCIHV